MEQVTALIRKIDGLELLVKKNSPPAFIADWLEKHGWRWLGGKWANLEFQNWCYTYSTRQALRIQLFRLLLPQLGLATITERQWMQLIQEIAK